MLPKVLLHLEQAYKLLPFLLCVCVHYLCLLYTLKILLFATTSKEHLNSGINSFIYDPPLLQPLILTFCTLSSAMVQPNCGRINNPS